MSKAASRYQGQLRVMHGPRSLRRNSPDDKAAPMRGTEKLPAELAVALAPVLRDLEAVSIRSRIESHGWSAVPEQITAMSWWPGGSGSGVYVWATESPARNIAMLADQLQDAAVDSLLGMGRPAVWPECPDHANGHPLRAGCVDDAAVLTCPRTGRQVAEIGQLQPVK